MRAFSGLELNSPGPAIEEPFCLNGSTKNLQHLKNLCFTKGCLWWKKVLQIIKVRKRCSLKNLWLNVSCGTKSVFLWHCWEEPFKHLYFFTFFHIYFVYLVSTSCLWSVVHLLTEDLTAFTDSTWLINTTTTIYIIIITHFHYITVYTNAVLIDMAFITA